MAKTVLSDEGRFYPVLVGSLPEGSKGSPLHHGFVPEVGMEESRISPENSKSTGLMKSYADEKFSNFFSLKIPVYFE